MIKIFIDIYNVDFVVKWIYMYISIFFVLLFFVGDRLSGEWFFLVWI